MANRILVTGGAGYIGSHVVKALQKSGFEVIVYDNLSTGFPEAVTCELIKADLNDSKTLDKTFEKYKFDGVMHFAGSIVVPESVENPIMYYKNNTENSLNLIATCLKFRVNSFIFSSTAAVYGLPKEQFVDETCQKTPINPYGMSKLMTENMLQDTAFAHKDFNYIALRYFNVSGADPEGSIGQAFPGATHLIKVNCEAAAGKRAKTYIYGTDFDTEDGTGVRDYIHVSDLARAHVMALEYLLKEKKSDVFNCGYGHGFSVKEVISAVKEVSGVDYTVEESGRRAGDPGFLVSNADKIQKVLNWKAEHDDLKFIIKTAYDWERSSKLSNWHENKK